MKYLTDETENLQFAALFGGLEFPIMGHKFGYIWPQASTWRH